MGFREVRSVAVRLTAVVDALAQESPLALHRVGMGSLALQDAARWAAEHARHSTCEMQLSYPFRPLEPPHGTFRATRTLIVPRSAMDENPYVAATHGMVRVGPVFSGALIVDDAIAVISGPPLDDGTELAYASRHHEVLRLTTRLWRMTCDLSAPAFNGARDPSPPDYNLARLLALGLTNAAIARELGISPKTATKRTALLCHRLGARDRFAAVAGLFGRGAPDATRPWAALPAGGEAQGSLTRS